MFKISTTFATLCMLFLILITLVHYRFKAALNENWIIFFFPTIFLIDLLVRKKVQKRKVESQPEVEHVSCFRLYERVSYSRLQNMTSVSTETTAL